MSTKYVSTVFNPTYTSSALLESTCVCNCLFFNGLKLSGSVLDANSIKPLYNCSVKSVNKKAKNEYKYAVIFGLLVI